MTTPTTAKRDREHRDSGIEQGSQVHLRRPVTAKKNGVKICPSGRISCSSSSCASVSATIRPATNAPMMAASPIAAETSATANISMNAGTSGVSANSGQVKTSRRSPRARRAAANPSATSPIAATATSNVDR